MREEDKERDIRSTQSWVRTSIKAWSYFIFTIPGRTVKFSATVVASVIMTVMIS